MTIKHKSRIPGVSRQGYGFINIKTQQANQADVLTDVFGCNIRSAILEKSSAGV